MVFKKNSSILLMTIVFLLIFVSIEIDRKLSLNGFLIIIVLFFIFIFLKCQFKIEVSIKVNKLNFIIYAITGTFLIYIFNTLISLTLDKEGWFNFIINKYDYLFYIKALILFPIVEELVFRQGVLYLLLQKKYSPIISIILSSFYFCILHWQVQAGLFYVFLGGIYLGFLYYKTRSVFLCIICHSIYNFFEINISPLIAYYFF